MLSLIKYPKPKDKDTNDDDVTDGALGSIRRFLEMYLIKSN